MQKEDMFGVDVFDAIFGSDWLAGSTFLEFVSPRTRKSGDQRADGIWVRPPDGGSDFLLDDLASADEKFVRFRHPTGNCETEPALQFPFTLTQFRRFCETYPDACEWMEIFRGGDGSLIDPMGGGYAQPEDYKVAKEEGGLLDDESRTELEIPLPPVPYWRRNAGAWTLLQSYFGGHGVKKDSRLKLTISGTSDSMSVQPADKETLKAPDGLMLTGEQWRQLARENGEAIRDRDKAKDLYPSRENIADEIARDWRKRGIKGPANKPLAGSTIAREALKGLTIGSPKFNTALGKRSNS